MWGYEDTSFSFFTLRIQQDEEQEFNSRLF